MPVDSDDRGGKSAPMRLRDLIPGSLLATLHGDLGVSDDPAAVCSGDNVYEVNADLTLASGREGRGAFAATEPDESWMLPETELEFLRCVVGRYIIFLLRNAIVGKPFSTCFSGG